MSENYTIYIAAYGAVLSTLVFYWTVRLSRANFEVDLLLGINDEEGEIESGIFVFVKNPSQHRINIVSIDLVYHYRAVPMHEKLAHCIRYRRFDKFIGWTHYSLNMFNIEAGLPVTIDPGHSHQVFIAKDTLLEALGRSGVDKFVASAQDALWRRKYSGPLAYPV